MIIIFLVLRLSWEEYISSFGQTIQKIEIMNSRSLDEASVTFWTLFWKVRQNSEEIDNTVIGKLRFTINRVRVKFFCFQKNVKKNCCVKTTHVVEKKVVLFLDFRCISYLIWLIWHYNFFLIVCEREIVDYVTCCKY